MHLEVGVARKVQITAGAAGVAHHIPQHPCQARLLHKEKPAPPIIRV